MATTENTKIIVHVHPGSAPAAFDLLERCKPWTSANDAILEVLTTDIVDFRQ